MGGKNGIGKGKVKQYRNRPSVAPEGSRSFMLPDFMTFGT